MQPGHEKTEADQLIKYAIEGTRKRIDVPELVRRYASDDSRTVVVQVLLGDRPMGYGFYIDPTTGTLETCNPQDITRPTVTVPLMLEGVFILLDPDRKEGPMDIYMMGLTPGFAGPRFLSHLRLLHAIFHEMKESLRQYAHQKAAQ